MATAAGSRTRSTSSGERWALLVVRELLLGPKRFTDLKDGLPNASPNVLTQRLRELDEAGIVRRRKLPPPAGSWIYELTDWGRDLKPIVLSLGTWALRSPSLPADAPVGTDSVILALGTFFDAEAAGDLNARYELRLGEHAFAVGIADRAIDVDRGTVDDPDAIIETDPDDAQRTDLGAPRPRRRAARRRHHDRGRPSRRVPLPRALPAASAGRLERALTGAQPRLVGGQDRQLVVAPVDARPERRDVRAVDVDGDGDVAPAGGHGVDVARRLERLHVPAPRVHGPGGPQRACPVSLLERVAVLALHPAQHADYAPRHVVVDGRPLARPPHQRDDREAAARGDVQQVLAIGVRARRLVLRRQPAVLAQQGAQPLGHRLRVVDERVRRAGELGEGIGDRAGAVGGLEHRESVPAARTPRRRAARCPCGADNPRSPEHDARLNEGVGGR